MDLNTVHGEYAPEEQEILSHRSVAELHGLLTHPSPWVRKDAALGILEIGINRMSMRELKWKGKLREPITELLAEMQRKIPAFYEGAGFVCATELERFVREYGTARLGVRNAHDGYALPATIPDRIPAGYDSVLAIHAGGTEAGMVAAAAIRAPLILGYYEYKEVEERAFVLVNEDGTDMGDRVLVIDDILKTGRSMGAAFDFLQAHGSNPEGFALGRFLPEIYKEGDLRRNGVRAITRDDEEFYIPC